MRTDTALIAHTDLTRRVRRRAARSSTRARARVQAPRHGATIGSQPQGLPEGVVVVRCFALRENRYIDSLLCLRGCCEPVELCGAREEAGGLLWSGTKVECRLMWGRVIALAIVSVDASGRTPRQRDGDVGSEVRGSALPPRFLHITPLKAVQSADILVSSSPSSRACYTHHLIQQGWYFLLLQNHRSSSS